MLQRSCSQRADAICVQKERLFSGMKSTGTHIVICRSGTDSGSGSVWSVITTYTSNTQSRRYGCVSKVRFRLRNVTDGASRNSFRFLGRTIYEEQTVYFDRFRNRRNVQIRYYCKCILVHRSEFSLRQQCVLQRRQDR